MDGRDYSLPQEWRALIVDPSADAHHAVARLEKAKQKLRPTRATESPRVENPLRSLERPRAGRKAAPSTETDRLMSCVTIRIP